MHEQLIEKAWRLYFAKVGRGAFASDAMGHEQAFKEAVKAVFQEREADPSPFKCASPCKGCVEAGYCVVPGQSVEVGI